MEGILYQRVTPLLKCVVLLLFVFTAKVLTTRPHDAQDDHSETYQEKPAHYVRTFTKYHHRRPLRIGLQDHWPMQGSRIIHKRSVDDLNSDEFVSSDNGPNNFGLDTLRNNNVFDKPVISVGKESISTKNGLTVVKTYKDKIKEKVVTVAPKKKGPTLSCLYKITNVATMPSYDDEKNTQQMVENEGFDIGPLRYEMVNGEKAQIEQCVDPRSYCFTLYQPDGDGNATVLGQGCWHGQGERCGVCRAISPRSTIKFCCCDTHNCNADYASLLEEPVTMRPESSSASGQRRGQYSGAVAGAVLLLLAALLGAALLHRARCRRVNRALDAQQLEKGEVMGSGPDALATGLSCVDNLTLNEHIGQGKFGSVWRGSLGSTPVAVKLYSSAGAWQREAAVYALPHLSHPNILRYYGSDTRPTLTQGGREHLIVLELCAGTLRARLERAPLAWAEFARLAHGAAAALAHLHTPSGNKPCVVHRDVNSNNILVSADGRARLADLGLAQLLRPRRDQAAPTRITEAGTLRYLAPEALEGALDLSGARAALCAVDVFALGLVLWEMLWRTAGAHAGPAPPYAPPYQQHGLPPRPTLAQMQSLVSRNKARPPLPAGPAHGAGGEARALRVARDTCDECWDHDAEARLTAVCVEERMAELRQSLRAHAPRVHANRLQPHAHAAADPVAVPEADKNSNCTTAQSCDIHTPLLYPQPHIGRNACIERNTHNSQANTVELIHKSLKDISANVDPPKVPNFEENCLSVARGPQRPPVPDFENSERLSEMRSYQRPLLDYVQNDVSCHEADRRPKQTNLQHTVKIEKPKWGIRSFFEKKLNRHSKALETEVKLLPDNTNCVQNGRTMTSVVDKPSNVTFDRPANLVLNDRAFDYEVPCTLSPPNRTLSPTMMLESDLNRENKVFGFKELPSRDESEPKAQNQIFAVIVPKAKPSDFTNLIEMRTKGRDSSESVNKRSVRTSMSSQSIFKSGHSESEDSTTKKRLSCDNRIINTNNSNSGRSSRASINLELQYIDNQTVNFNGNDSPFDLNSDCSSSEDEHLLLLSENGGSKITMQTVPKLETDRRKYDSDVLKEASQTKTDFVFNKHQNRYTNFDNEFSDPHDKENLVNGYSGDNPVYLATLNGEISTDIKFLNQSDGALDKSPKSPKPSLKNLTIKRQHSLEQVSELFTSSGDVNLLNPAGRVKTPGDLPVAVRRARRDRALQRGRAGGGTRLSLYDDRMMFGNSL